MLQKWKMFNPTTVRHSKNRYKTLLTATLHSRFISNEIAHNLFDEIPHRTLHANNRILKSYCRDKRYKEALSLFSRLSSSEKPDLYSIPTALKACAALKALGFGKAIHSFSKKDGQIGSNLFVGSALIDMYAKCGAMDESLRVFEEYPEPDTVLWTTVVTGFEHNGRSLDALGFFSRMSMAEGVVIDPVALVSVVSACVQLLELKVGRSVHGYVIRMGLGNGLPLSNALLNLYGKTGLVNYASRLFEGMEEKDVISWGSMIACYAHHGGAKEALALFKDMIFRGIEANAVALISVLQACEAACSLDEGKRIHELAARSGLDADVLVSTALIAMYMSCSAPDEAAEVFKRMPEKDAVSFSAMLRGCVENERAWESIGVLRAMLASDFRPDAYDLVKILTACSELGVLQQTRCFHGFVIKGGLGDDSFVSASLVECYAKCGSLECATSIFGCVKDRDVVVWSSMLAAFGIHGKGREALALFDEMVKNSGVRPNEVSFVSILSACSHAGLVREGIEMFDLMVNGYKLAPNSKHYGIVVDLLGRVGEVEKAMGFVNGMADGGDPSVWGALLGSCRVHRDNEIAEIAGRKLVELDGCDAGYYVLLSNVYAVDEKWREVARVRGLVEKKKKKKKKMKKVSGRIVVVVGDQVCSFVANDRYCQQSNHIFDL
ncbi:putative pentatricopeptide repeat-containing protein At3g01580 [Salvia splendens]|nr:putative pentatricopeptide repeat-containing protein At3g01580 [Salvia splendens]